jgi:glycosyltransferase involved in cell wall biosynthesis
LVLLCHNPFLQPHEARAWERLYRESPLRDRIVILPRLNSQAEVAAVMAAADCGVFPSRAEGWNLPLAEMLRMGKHVIATNCSAHTEFCDPDNSLLIDVDRLEDAHDGRWFRGQGRWAALGEVQVEQLLVHLRSIHQRKLTGTLGVNQAGIDTLKRFTWQRTAESLVSALQEP